jgi:hypothetical protein
MISTPGEGSKVVFKNYSAAPVVEMNDGLMTVTVGESCGAGTMDGDDANAGDGSSATRRLLMNYGLPLLLGQVTASALSISSSTMIPGVTLAAAGLLSLSHSSSSTSSSSSSFMVQAQTTAECDAVPIEVEIYLDATSDEIVMRNSQSGDFEVCPPEST